MQNTRPTAASAAQIAAAVGVSVRTTQRALADVAPAGALDRRGNYCAGYSLDQLPARFQEKVLQQKDALLYRTPEAVFSNPKPQWNPEIPLASQSQESVEYAHSLKRALSFFIANRNSSSFRPGELTRQAVVDFTAAFRRTVTKRHVERLIKTVIERDGGREEFDRIELYLPIRSGQSDGQEKPFAQRSGAFTGIDDALAILADISILSHSEKASIWKAAIMDYESFLDEGANDKKAKRLVLDFLWVRVPKLSESPDTLRRQFDRKLTAYREAGVAAICDKRKENSGRRLRSGIVSFEALDTDEKALLVHANKIGGGLSRAFRDLNLGLKLPSGATLQFSQAFRDRYAFDVRENKSYVPQGLRDKLRPLLKSVEPFNHGPRAVKLATPSIHRDWSKVRAGAWYQSDDETANHYVWFPCEFGEYEFQGMRFDVLRPQILPMVDVRTDYVLSVLMLCRKNYNSHAIRSLMLKTCLNEAIGLPFEGFYFEGNIWQARNIQAMVDWTQIDDAFSRSGLQLRIKKATTPKAKIIERIFSQEQNAMQALPGYAGRNERTDGYERVRAALASFKRFGQPRKGEVDPRKHLLNAEQYLDRLQAAYEAFNNEPQTGERLQGMAPAEAWKALSGGIAHQVVPDSLRYLLATEQSEVTVGREGIGLRFGKAKRYFFENNRLGLLVGEKVLVRWNQEFPDHVVVVHPKSDPHGSNPFVVPHDPSLDALGASDDDFAAARRRRESFMEPQRAMFRSLNHAYGLTMRDEGLGSPALRQAGAAHNRAERGEVASAGERRVSQDKARKLAHRAGFDSTQIKNPVRAAIELEGIEDLEARLIQQESENE